MPISIPPYQVEIVQESVVESLIVALRELYDNPNIVALAFGYAVRAQVAEPLPIELNGAFEAIYNFGRLFQVQEASRGSALFQNTFGVNNPGLEVLRAIIYRGAINYVRTHFNQIDSLSPIEWHNTLESSDRVTALTL